MSDATLEYAVIWGLTPCELENAVMNWIANGWLPQGGVCYSGGRFQWCQAMVRTAKAPEPLEERIVSWHNE